MGKTHSQHDALIHWYVDQSSLFRVLKYQLLIVHPFAFNRMYDRLLFWGLTTKMFGAFALLRISFVSISISNIVVD